MKIFARLCLFFVFLVSCKGQETPASKGTRCYDLFNRPQRCIPEFENAAFNVLMEVTNTCGDNGPKEYCVQTGVTGIKKSCETCYPNQHHARYLTDVIHPDNPTWWQSETMMEGIQWPNQVNLTLNLDKAFDITYVRLLFQSPRPESFYISKKATKDGTWIPFQFYSATCRDTYGLPDSTHTTRGDETRALCTSEYSDISPLKGGNVAFGTLEGRPSAYNFDSSLELQEWVTATEIRITLDRLNTFGDEVFGDAHVLQSYFYAIADVAVGARCKCNGHASECITSSGVDGTRRRVCKCEHNTAGPDCNECLPFYNDAPWHRATGQNAHDCKQCNCNGFSNRCYFDEKLYELSGHGGHCLDCTANRDGPNCERCRENYYMREDGYCIACECNTVGSRNLQCNTEGKCQCKPGITGDKCDRCEVNYYDFSSQGCKTCGCYNLGSLNNQPNCDTYSGICQCKENVEGRQCGECKPGYFNLDYNNKFGCTPCFCYGHSSQCSSAAGFSGYLVESTFAKSSERWGAEDEFGRAVEIKYDGFSQTIAAQADGEEVVYFMAPERFLGDQRASYNQLLEFVLRIGDNRPIPTATDIILEGGGTSVTNTIFAQQNKIPAIQNQVYRFRLHEHPEYGWQPRLSAQSYMSLLTNLTSIKIKGTYSPNGVGFLDNVKLETASKSPGQPALWVESCDCPEGYVGQFCESCAPGFKHSPARGGPFMPCVACDCNNHASICDSETGRCICNHNTTGENCELCARGYYGNALGGTPNDCTPCGCPRGGACIQLDDDVIVCTECPVEYTGPRCENCADGFFGDPTGRFGISTPCRTCECNENIDANGVGNCNTTTGECLKCIYNTGGSHCEACLPGYYGNALALPKGDCKPCQCYSLGTIEDPSGALVCDQSTGVCNCKSHVIGKNCDQCEDGYYNLQSGEGCHSCNCDPIGSLNQTCNVYNGQCHCRPGVTGLRCDHCEAKKYGFSTEGCRSCECDVIGSKDLQCDAFGQCPCLENVEGRRCDRCKENKYDRHRGCIDCPDCYNLVQDAATTHNNKLDRLKNILNEIEQNPTVISDEKFPGELAKVQHDIGDFYEKVKNVTGEDSIAQQIRDIKRREDDISRTLSEVDENIYTVNEKSQRVEINIDHIEHIMNEAEDKLFDINTNINTQGKNALEEANKRSQLVGQQSKNMTKIAQEARELADKLDVKADVISVKAKDAKNKSIEAYEVVKNANNEQTHIADEVRRFRNELLHIENKLNKTKEWTKDVSDKAIEVKTAALNLFTEVKNLEIPQVDIPNLKQRSTAIREEAHRLGNKSEGLFQDSESLRQAILEESKRSRELLEEANDQQDETDELLNEIHVTKEATDNSINSWNKVLNETENLYKYLKDFDSETQKSKKEAEEALNTINEIDAIIRDTQQKNYEAQQRLRESSENANLAVQTAMQADDLAKNTSEDLGKIRNEAAKLQTNSTVLTDAVKSMADRLMDTDERLEKLRRSSGTNDTLINEAKDKVGGAKVGTDGVSEKVSKLLEGVNSIIAELQNAEDIDETEIEKLENEIRDTEKRIKDARLEEQLEELQQEHISQTNLITQYKIDISRLQKDVENIAQIVAALPEGCFRKVELEP